MLRFAPSPTQDMCVSDMRIALVNYIASRQNNEQFILRIEDIDKSSSIPNKDQEIKDIMKKFAIEPDLIFYQHESIPRHQQFAVSLVEHNKAFLCTCPILKSENSICSNRCQENQETIRSKVNQENLKYIIRIKKPSHDVSFEDQIQGFSSLSAKMSDDFIIIQDDKIPTQDFASACDDMLMDISMIIRDQKLMPNTFNQIHTKETIGYTKPTAYAHLPSISNEADLVSIKWLLEQGFLPDAIINYLLSMGCETPEDVFTLPEAIEWFDLSNISRTPVKFDINKLRDINRQHLWKIEDKKLSKLFGFADADIGKLAKIYLDEVSTINELKEKIESIFAPKKPLAKDLQEIQTISSVIISAPMFDDFDDFTQYISEQSKIDKEALVAPLRLLITNAQNGPKLTDIYPLIKPYITQIVKIENK